MKACTKNGRSRRSASRNSLSRLSNWKQKEQSLFFVDFRKRRTLSWWRSSLIMYSLAKASASQSKANWINCSSWVPSFFSAFSDCFASKMKTFFLSSLDDRKVKSNLRWSPRKLCRQDRDRSSNWKFGFSFGSTVANRKSCSRRVHQAFYLMISILCRFLSDRFECLLRNFRTKFSI